MKSLTSETKVFDSIKEYSSDSFDLKVDKHTNTYIFLDKQSNVEITLSENNIMGETITLTDLSNLDEKTKLSRKLVSHNNPNSILPAEFSYNTENIEHKKIIEDILSTIGIESKVSLALKDIEEKTIEAKRVEEEKNKAKIKLQAEAETKKIENTQNILERIRSMRSGENNNGDRSPRP